MPSVIRSLIILVILSISINVRAQDTISTDDVFQRIFEWDNIDNDDTTWNWERAKTGGKYCLSFNGLLLKTGVYRDGRKDGLWHDYDLTGNVCAEKHYRGGIPFGVWKYYHNGKRFYTEEYNNVDSLQILWTWHSHESVLFTWHNDQMDQRTLADSVLKITTDDQYNNILSIGGTRFTGIFIHEDEPTMTWEGKVLLKNGIANGENIHYGDYSHQINGRNYGVQTNGQTRHGYYSWIGYYYNDKKYGKWVYRSFSTDPEYTAEIIYDNDLLVSYQLSSNDKLVTDTSKREKELKKINGENE